MFLAADVLLVTPLRDGMNLVAKEYVACRHDGAGALVLSEFTGAWHELHQAYVCNPHDIAGLKQTILTAMRAPEAERRRRMKAMRRRVADHDVQRWASRFLEALEQAPAKPTRTPREQREDEAQAAADDKAEQRHHAEHAGVNG
jgi:trehalose 6-phosphate synthase